MHFVDDKSPQLYIRGRGDRGSSENGVTVKTARTKVPLWGSRCVGGGGHYYDSLHVAMTNSTLTFREVRWLVSKPEF